MILAYITLLTAIAISGIAGYFSIVGLIAIFSATPISIAIMGVSLEVAKLVTASWLYRNWSTAPVTIKYYFTVAVLILSLLTSMGIFGYLSKSHIEQATVSNVNSIELNVLNQQEQIIKTRISFLLQQSEKSTNANIRISKELNEAQNQLREIVNKKAPLLQTQNQLSAEIGPLKYITEFIYGRYDEDLLNKAVRWVIITLIFVFDPLAILLLVSANISFNQYSNTTVTVKNKKTKKSKFTDFDINSIKIDKSSIYEVPKEIVDRILKK